MPCGFLDQASSAFGEEGRVVRLLCGVSPVAVGHCTVRQCGDTKINIWVFASGARHQLVDSPYKARFEECKAAAAALGVQLLSECSLEHLEERRSALTAAQFLRAKHVIQETHRVHDSVQVISSALTNSNLISFCHVLMRSFCAAAIWLVLDDVLRLRIKVRNYWFVLPAPAILIRSMFSVSSEYLT
jgi:galactokinase